MQEYCIKTSSYKCFGYLLELPPWGNSNKYPKHMFYEEIRIKQGFSKISFCPLRILYNSKFIIMATSLGTNAVVVTRVHCRSCLKKYRLAYLAGTVLAQQMVIVTAVFSCHSPSEWCPLKLNTVYINWNKHLSTLGINLADNKNWWHFFIFFPRK